MRVPEPRSSSTCVLCIERVAAKADFTACPPGIVRMCCRHVRLVSACAHAGAGENATHVCSAMHAAEKETITICIFLCNEKHNTERNKYLHIMTTSTSSNSWAQKYSPSACNQIPKVHALLDVLGFLCSYQNRSQCRK